MRYFVTGTDTDVGKTVISACLAESARDRGSVIAAKPVASGVSPSGAGEDAILLATAAGHAPTTFQTYVPPVSPHRAILDGGSPIDPSALESWIRGLRADRVLVEGVGGWRVPIQIAPPIDVTDLARWTDGPVIVVARDRLGVLNHARLTVDAIRADGLTVVGLVLNRLPGDPGVPSNLADLRMLLGLPVAVADPLDPRDAEQRARVGNALWNGLSGTG